MFGAGLDVHQLAALIERDLHLHVAFPCFPLESTLGHTACCVVSTKGTPGNHTVQYATSLCYRHIDSLWLNMMPSCHLGAKIMARPTAQGHRNWPIQQRGTYKRQRWRWLLYKHHRRDRVLQHDRVRDLGRRGQRIYQRHFQDQTIATGQLDKVLLSQSNVHTRRAIRLPYVLYT